MGDVLCFFLSFYIFSLTLSMLGGFLRFLRDIRKWKSPEEKVHITVEEFEKDLFEDNDDTDVKEVEDNAGNDSECHTPIIF